MTDCIRKKIEFVKELNAAITKVQPNVVAIRYRVLAHRPTEWYEEYLEIEYSSGARTLRHCSGDSCSAILTEISRYLNSGYYGEIAYFESLFASGEYIEETID